MKFSPLAHSVSIVMVGNFNPAIFHPSWLKLHNVVTDEQVEASDVKIVHAEIAQFEVADLGFTVEAEKFRVATTREPFVQLSDVVEVIFGELLGHTPIKQVSLEYELHFALENAKQRIELGRALAPLEPWGDWGKTLESADSKLTGGLRSLILERPNPTDGPKGYRRIQIEPSVRADLVETSVGVYMAATDHFVALDEASQSAAACVDWVGANFDDSLETSRQIIAGLMEFAAKL